MCNKRISLTKASGIIFWLVTVFVFASSSWAAKMEVDNQSTYDVTVFYGMKQAQGLARDAFNGFTVYAGDKHYEDIILFWTYKITDIQVKFLNDGKQVCETTAPEDGTYYHAKVVVTDNNNNSRKCTFKLY
ncbi:MAG: hypothetical protein ACNI3A_07870 [Desulfovibrio sp.]|uniref:hypothetical protein n=1 Tax=Desulfovibrio sp. 7SRBS1 TaxID=3378064 RepID=UPI003B3CEAB0